MKILMLWKYYRECLNYFYHKYPQTQHLAFAEHREKIFGEHFGWPSDLCRYMQKIGLSVEFIIANDEQLQKKWAKESGFSSYSENNWEKAIALEQIRRFRPDILWVGSIFDYFGQFIKEALPYYKKAIAWISCVAPLNLNISGFTTLITTYPQVFKNPHTKFKEVFVTRPGFDCQVLKDMGPIQKQYDITFIGQITRRHLKRLEILAYLIKNGIDIKVFGFFPEIQKLSKIRAAKETIRNIFRYRDLPEAIDTAKEAFFNSGYYRNLEVIQARQAGVKFGLDMYKTLAASRATLNVHIDIVDNCAGNMRMFEATGVGTCVLTEDFENINELFEPEKEVVAYKSKEELLDIIQSLLKAPDKVEQIAGFGQRKTLKFYTIERMYRKIEPAFKL